MHELAIGVAKLAAEPLSLFDIRTCCIAISAFAGEDFDEFAACLVMDDVVARWWVLGARISAADESLSRHNTDDFW